eukprot:250177_1
MNANITGCMFVKGTAEYKSSLKFAKMFQYIKGYQKKAFADIYAKLNSTWDHSHRIEVAKMEMKYDNTEIQMECDESKHNHNPPMQWKESQSNESIYEIGIQFYYWHSLRHHKHYVDAKYSHLKEEILNNPVRRLDISQWEKLCTECKTDIDTDVVRNIKANGLSQYMYKIAKFTLLSKHHLA